MRVHDRAAEIIAPGREVDLTVREQALALFEQAGPVDYVIHLADVGGNARWAAEHAISQLLANSYMATHVIEGWTTFQRSARLVGMSSLWAYPERVEIVREENYWDGQLHAPTQTYGLVKKLFGAAIDAARRQMGMKGSMLVLGNVFGPDDPSDRVIPSLMRRMRSNPELLEIHGDGSETRDFIFIDDQVDGIITHLDYDGDLLNIGSGVSYTIREVVEELARLMPYTGRIVFNAASGAGVKQRQIDVSRATAATGWPSTIRLHSLGEGLRLTLAASN